MVAMTIESGARRRRCALRRVALAAEITRQASVQSIGWPGRLEANSVLPQASRMPGPTLNCYL